MKSKLFLLLLLSLLISDMMSQVTIGQDTAPVSGALLQLQEYFSNPNGTNANKGLGLPRVNLKTLSGNLAVSMGNLEDTYDNDAHVGLVVYNVQKPLCPNIEQGPYVWDGNMWKPLFKSELNTFIEKDQEGHLFYAGKFGDAGIWMLQNLAVKTYADGTIISANSPKAVSSATDPHWCYPGVDRNDDSDPSIYLSQPEVGFLYNWVAATRNYVPTNLVQGQVPGSVPGVNEVENLGSDGSVAGKKYVQGVCPNGWHLPSDREWNELEKEITNSYTKYSNYTSLPYTWNADWESGNFGTPGYNGRPANDTYTEGHLRAMLSPCLLDGVEGDASANKSKPAIHGGFSGVLAGYGANSLTGYGEYGYYWASSSGNAVGAWLRVLYLKGTSVLRYNAYRYQMQSVRCKKNID